MAEHSMTPQTALTAGRSLISALALAGERQGERASPVAVAAPPAVNVSAATDDESGEAWLDAVRLAESMNRSAEAEGRSLRFRVDEETGRIAITVLNADTGEVVRHIPLNEARTLAERFGAPGEGAVLRMAV